MHIDDIRAKDKEVLHWKRKYKRTIKLCKCIRENFDSIDYIHQALEKGDDLAASEAWNELDYSVQDLLITAPTFGGPFTTKERAQIVGMWDLSIEDIERKTS
jgi:hypothetical protein